MQHETIETMMTRNDMGLFNVLKALEPTSLVKIRGGFLDGEISGNAGDLLKAIKIQTLNDYKVVEMKLSRETIFSVLIITLEAYQA